MSLYPGDNVPVSIGQRRVLLSGTDPAIFPAPLGGRFAGIFDGGRVVVSVVAANTYTLTLLSAPFPRATGGGRNAELVEAFAREIYAGEFATQNPEVVFGGTVPADLASVPSPGLEMDDGAWGRRSPAISVGAGMDAAWILFALHQAGTPHVVPTLAGGSYPDMTIMLSESDADTLVSGPESPVDGRLTVREVEVFGTTTETLIRIGARSSIEVNQPIGGQVRISGEMVGATFTALDMDGEWTVDGERWELARAQMTGRGTARVELTQPTGV